MVPSGTLNLQRKEFPGEIHRTLSYSDRVICPGRALPKETVPVLETVLATL